MSKTVLNFETIQLELNIMYLSHAYILFAHTNQTKQITQITINNCFTRKGETDIYVLCLFSIFPEI